LKTFIIEINWLKSISKLARKQCQVVFKRVYFGLAADTRFKGDTEAEIKPNYIV
jgi:hypothetical protein